jgi:tyrosyl-tRNA synthetase
MRPRFWEAEKETRMTPVFRVLQDRGFISQLSDESLPELLSESRLTVYAGFDPTADSLHLGHLVPIMALAHFQRAGHRPLMVVGGATGMVGDPSGRSEERNLLTREQITANVLAVRRQMERFLAFDGPNPATILDNFDWIGSFSFLDWLRDVGKHFTVAAMLAKESVQRRLEGGISYTEFSYMTLQAYDFQHLFTHHGCTLQVGGSDQWGNITAGIDLIRRVRQGQAYGITFPLVTTSSGEKFGKTAGNVLWLDPRHTSPWDFYQYLVRQDDRDVIRLLNLYTFLPSEVIGQMERAVREEPHRRAAQKRLAFEVTALVHGQETAHEMAHAAEVVYQSEIRGISDATLAAVFASVSSTTITRSDLESGIQLPDALVRTGLVSSKGEARRLLQSGAIYVNNLRQGSDVTLGVSHLASPSFIVLRSGKKNYHLVRVQ